MKTYKYILPILCASAVMTSCEDVFEPSIEMVNDTEVMYKDATFAAGLLGNAYILLPYSDGPQSDLATDDAVSNQNNNNYTLMARGAWSSSNDPVSQWQARNNAIQYVNLLLENVDKVSWSLNTALNQMFIDQNTGDCLGMRALQRFYLLRAHAGKVGGELMGVPFFDEYQTATSDLNLPRLTFQECIDRIMADINAAMELLPETYRELSDTEDNLIPAKYKSLGATVDLYNRAFGSHYQGRLCGKVLKAIKAQILLFCASPAYGTATWESAAQAAAEVVKDKKVVDNGHIWYAQTTEIDNLGNREDPEEMIWRARTGASNSLESNNFPPSLSGNGQTNPTQNLVDAFPMANGYPISDSRSGYNAQAPYTDRDPRLNEYVVVNGSTMGVQNSVIYTGVYGDNDNVRHNNDNINLLQNKSTRTGYYLRKLMRNDINLSNNTTQKHYRANIRLTELFLDYAEAANEAYGPTQGVAGCSHTAKSVIKAIRERAGICKGVADPYLDECAMDKDKMRKLIQNERRLELCFENHRFYDLRRWNLPLNESTTGMTNTDDANYSIINVDPRQFESYMIYGPIPDSEIKKYSNLVQNDGWR